MCFFQRESCHIVLPISDPVLLCPPSPRWVSESLRSPVFHPYSEPTETRTSWGWRTGDHLCYHYSCWEMWLGSGPQGRDTIPLNHPASSCSQHRGTWAHRLCWLRTEGLREEATERSRRLAHEVRSFSQPLQSDSQQEQQADVSRRFSEKNAELLEAGSALFGDT